jgi:hypothetical protein
MCFKKIAMDLGWASLCTFVHRSDLLCRRCAIRRSELLTAYNANRYLRPNPKTLTGG